MTVMAMNLEHIVTVQQQAEAAFLAEYRAGSHDFANPYLKLNPYLIAPLTALIMFRTAEPTTVQLRVLGKAADGDMTFSFAAAMEHIIPVYGLYADYTNQVELTLSSGETTIVTIPTEPAPAKVRPPVAITTTAAYFGDNVMFVSPTSPAMTAAYDYQGDVRWYTTLNFAFDIKRARNGRLLLGSHRLVLQPYHTTGICEMGMIGKIYREYRLPGGYHHDHLELPDGNLLILTQDLTRGTVEDMCVLVDRQTGAILKTWDYQMILPMEAGNSGDPDRYDWFHNNAVWYDERTNSLTLSGRRQDIVINIDYDTGALNWMLGDPGCWPPEWVEKYFFKPALDQEFEWQYAQHSCVVIPTGDVMVFDNGHRRSKVRDNYLPAKLNYSRGVRYALDRGRQEIRQVWQYGKERGTAFFSSFIGNVEYYGEDHYLVHAGGTGTFRGETCERPPVQYRGEDEQDVEFRSITVETEQGVIKYELELPANYYRAEKLPLYCAGDVLTFGQGELLGSLGITSEYTGVVEAQPAGPVPDVYNVKLGIEEDRIVLRAHFIKGQVVILQLSGTTTHNYLIPTTKRPFLAACMGAFGENDPAAVEFPVSKEGLAGEFSVRLIIDDCCYHTGVDVNLAG